MKIRIAALLAAAFFSIAAAPLSPEAAWKQGIADQNKDYAQTPHAMLKIQDAAYLGEGQTATLQGIKGKPESWRWHYDGKLPTNETNDKSAPLILFFKNGKLGGALNGKPLDPKQVAKSVAVDADVDIVGQPTQVGAGVPGWRIFVYNQKNPAAVNFKSVSYYPYDPAFRVTARFSPDAKLTPKIFRTSRGTDKQFFHAGDAHFTLKGKALTLAFYADDNKNIKDISAFYTDGLTGKGAYGAGRYVDADTFGKFPPANITINFNDAYNPNCARSAFFTCPLAGDALPLEMTAGEQDPHFTH